MANGANIKINVDVTQFRQGMQQAQQSAKTLQTQMKANEAQFKATGDKEQYLTEKGKLLKAELEAQKKAAENAEKALEAMKEKGVSETSNEYQKMAQQLAGIQTAMYNTQTAMNNMTVSETKASSGAKDLSTNLNSIAKNVSLDAVIRGIDSITGAMEKAVKKAGELGRAIWDNISDAAARADDAQTAAAILGMDVETYQRYEKVFSTVGDITVSEWQKAKKRVQQAIYSPSSQQVDVFEALGIKTYSYTHDGGKLVKLTKDYEDILWEVGRRLREEVESGRMSQGQADIYAQAIFGRSYDSLNPLLNMGQEAFEQAVSQQEVLTEEEVDALATLNDELIKLKGDFQTLQDQILAGLAPALKDAATILDNLLTNLIEFLHSDDGKALLQQMGDAVSGLFEDLSKIDPQQVVQGFTDVFTKIVGGLEWLYEHKDDVIHALEAVVVGWGALKLTGGALDILKLVNGVKTIRGTGGLGAVGSVLASGATDAISAAIEASAGGFATTFVNILGTAKWALAILTIVPLIEAIAHVLGAPDPNMDKIAREADKMNGGNGKVGWNPLWDLLTGKATIGDVIEHDTRTLGKSFKLATTESARTQEITDRVLDEIGFSRPKINWGYTIHGSGGASAKFGPGLSPLWEALTAGGESVPIEVEPVAADGSKASLQEQVNNMNIAVPVQMVLTGGGNGAYFTHAGGNYGGNVAMKHANGIWSVPWDGYPAILHRGERVVPNRGDSYTSNVYFGSVNLNNGLEVEALTESIDRRNRRMRAGYGS